MGTLKGAVVNGTSTSSNCEWGRLRGLQWLEQIDESLGGGGLGDHSRKP